MGIHMWSYCHDEFTPSRYRPDQVVCSTPACQRRRRAAYHRQKLRDDPIYRDQCRESQRHWREQHPEYMQQYRREPRKLREQTAPKAILDRVKNNLDHETTIWSGRIYIVGGKGAKNIVATGQILVIAGLKQLAQAL